MENRRAINERLVGWISRRAAEDFAGDISLVVTYGSHVNGTDNHLSDVDCYFVPKTRRGYDFSNGFILGGVGYDIFPVTWERLEGFADLKESLLPLLGDGRIIYCDSDEDLRRFNELKDRMKRNLADDAYVRETAKARCEFAAMLLGMLKGGRRASETRVLAGYAAMFIAEAVGFVNHDYFHFGLKKQYEDLCGRFPEIPREIKDGYRAVAEAEIAGRAGEFAVKMLEDACRYMGIKCEIPADPGAGDAPEKPDAQTLAGIYQEIVSTFNKIYVCCESGNHILAFFSAVCLQHELDETGFGEFELLADFDYRNLPSLAETAREIERKFVGYIVENGGIIKRYADFDEFERAQI